MATFSVSIPDELAAEMDAARGLVGRSRWIQEAVRAYLAKQQPVIVGHQRVDPEKRIITERNVLGASPSSRELRAEDRAKALEGSSRRGEINRQLVPEPREPAAPVLRGDLLDLPVYMCPEERCFQTAAKPGVCPSHRSRRMVRA